MEWKFTAFAVVLLLLCEVIVQGSGEKLHKKTFRSPAVHLGPGDVADNYMRVPMPTGHIALRQFDAQLVDESGAPIPLTETYLHHWILLQFYAVKGTTGFDMGSMQLVPNAGVCGHGNLVQWFGLGSETRRTDTTVPAPYGIVIGDPELVPQGHEEAWVLNLHAIDTRGAVDVRGCTECVCQLYNVTVDGNGRPLPAGYEGGLDCCYDRTHCSVRPGFISAGVRAVYMEYTVTWVDMSDAILPLSVYIFDVTDKRTAFHEEGSCEIEYTVDKCVEGTAESECIHTADSVAFLPIDGDVIYAVAHQHSGGIGASLHNEDGEEICTSYPIYGNGDKVANEAGYIVGMFTCHPEPGSVKIRGGEKLKVVSWYSNEERHTGVMGLWYLLVSHSQIPPPKKEFHTNVILVAVTVVAALIFIGLAVSRQLKGRRAGPEYQLVG